MTAAQPQGTERPDLGNLDDPVLVDLARNGSDEAYAALYSRHAYAAQRLARHLGMRHETDDVVSESFAQVLELMRRGLGPRTSFRAYLFTTIRNDAGRRAKARQKVVPTDDDATIDALVGVEAEPMDVFERSTIRAAYQSLPERWRAVLWHVEVEQRKPQEIATEFGLSPNGVSALAYRARSALREAYLKHHIRAGSPPSRPCRDAREALPAWVRGTLPERRGQQVRAHLRGCADCSAIVLDLEDANTRVGRSVREG